MNDDLPNEPRTFNDIAKITAIDKGSPAERIGLMAGDHIIAFGTMSPLEILEDPQRLNAVKKADWLIVIRDKILFRVAASSGIEGAKYERGEPAIGIALPADDAWIGYHACIELYKGLILIPEVISPFWALIPAALFARYRLWQMLTALMLVYGLSYAMNPMFLGLAYLVSTIAVIMGQSALLTNAAAKQGFVARCIYQLPPSADDAALELHTRTLCAQERERQRLARLSKSHR
jgi:hypothetical protein